MYISNLEAGHNLRQLKSVHATSSRPKWQCHVFRWLLQSFALLSNDKHSHGELLQIPLSIICSGDLQNTWHKHHWHYFVLLCSNYALRMGQEFHWPESSSGITHWLLWCLILIRTQKYLPPQFMKAFFSGCTIIVIIMKLLTEFHWITPKGITIYGFGTGSATHLMIGQVWY